MSHMALGNYKALLRKHGFRRVFGWRGMIMTRLRAILVLGHYGALRMQRERYLQLMEDCLVGRVYQDPSLPANGGGHYDGQLREYGWDWPSMAHSMIGSRRMRQLRTAAETVLFERIPGDFAEAGVWRGGACILLRAVLEAYQVKERSVWVMDSFQGLPVPDAELYPADVGDDFHTYTELCVSKDEVQENFRRYGLLDDRVRFLPGWFKHSLPGSGIKELAILRIDADMYESTKDVLTNLYDHVSIGGFVIIDDYHVVEGCKKATTDFRHDRKIYDPIVEIDGVGVYWRKRCA